MSKFFGRGNGDGPTNWLRATEGPRRIVSSLVGFGSPLNLAAWAFAGTTAYFVFYLPEQRRKEAEQIALAASIHERRQYALRHAEKAAPKPDMQATGLIQGQGKQ